MPSASETVKVEGRNNLGKVLYPAARFTKGLLLEGLEIHNPVGPTRRQRQARESASIEFICAYKVKQNARIH